MKQSKLSQIAIAFVAAISFLTVGCTHMIRPPSQPFTAYVGQEKVPMKVGVNLTDDLRNAKSVYHSMGDTWVIPIGGSIATNAPVLAEQTFDGVVVMNNGVLPSGQQVDAILTPRVAYINRTVGATSFGDSIVDIKVEWTLADTSGNTIWVNTVDGQAKGSTGWTNPKTILKKAIENLLRNSQQELNSSPAIREFAKQRAH